MSGIKIIVILLLGIYLLGGILLYFYQEKLIFLPEPLEKDYRYKFNADFEEVDLKMKDGAVINMLHFKHEDAKGLIVYFHGNAGNLARWGEIVVPFVEMGYEVLISDYRGYGKSTGSRSHKNLLDDAEAVYVYAKTLFAEDQVIVYGRSLGSAFASYLVGKNSPRQLILETPFYSLKDVANNTVPIYPTAQLLKYDYKNYQYLKGAELPIFIFHGTQDEVVPYSSGKKLRQSLGPNAHFVTVDGGHHNDLSLFGTYWTEIEKILE